MNKIYHKTDLYAQHLETYKNKRVCDEIQALTDGFHDLEAVYRDYVEHDSLDGFAVDFIPHVTRKTVDLTAVLPHALSGAVGKTAAPHIKERKVEDREERGVSPLSSALSVVFRDEKNNFLSLVRALFRLGEMEYDAKQLEAVYDERVSRQTFRLIHREFQDKLDRYCLDLTRFCGTFIGLYEIDPGDISNKFFYVDMGIYCLVFKKWVMVVCRGSDE